MVVCARTYRRAAQQQRHLAIGDGLLGEIIVNDQGVLAVVAEPIKYLSAGKNA